MDDVARSITAHYSRHPDLARRILAALPAAGGDPAQPTYTAVHQLDQFHLGGPAASRTLADMAGIQGRTVLDVGCGVGGPARLLAAEYGCDVTGVDLTERFLHTGATISRWVGLDDRTRFVCGSATHLPVAEAGVPAVWSQHAAMNIPDKGAMYGEIARVLAPGGVFAMHDIVAGPVREPVYPLPWASTPSESFLLPANTVHGMLRTAGLTEWTWRDATRETVAKLRDSRARIAAGEPEGPGPHLVMGPAFETMRANLARCLEEGRVNVVHAVWRKPA